MSKLTELIEELCPDGVEYRPLGELGKRNKGMVITASRMKELHHEGGEVRIFAGGYTIADVDRDDLPGEAVIDVPSIIVKSRGNIGFEYHTRPFTHKNELWSYTLDDPDVDQKFIFYYLQSRVSYFQLKAKSGKLPQIGVRDTDQFSVPTPPLEVQQEIVRVLDAFTDLEQSLVSELELRKKQFDVYRGKLFNLGDFVEWSTLGEVSAKVVSGGTPDSRNPSYYGGDIPWLRTQEINFKDIHETEMYITEEGLNNSSAKWIPANCVIVAMYGATAAKSAVNIIPLTTNQACCNLEINPSLAEYRFVFHWVSHMYENLKSLGEGSQSNINSKKVKSFRIPLPPLETQREILTKLDTFKSLIQSIEQEITLRRRQYEFYRDELLSFTPKED